MADNKENKGKLYTLGFNRIVHCPSYFADLLFEYRKKLLVEVSTAEKLSDKNLASLKDLLEKKYDQAIQIETVIDPSLIAGLKVKVGDHIIDGSVRSKLDRLSYQLCEDLV